MLFKKKDRKEKIFYLEREINKIIEDLSKEEDMDQRNFLAGRLQSLIVEEQNIYNKLGKRGKKEILEESSKIKKEARNLEIYM